MKKAYYMKQGRQVEEYISSFCDDNLKDVTTDPLYKGVDFIINGVEWDVKNAWNTENGGNKTLRELRGIKKWFRLNKDGTTNWHLFPYREIHLSESGFRKFINMEPESTLDIFLL